MPSTSFHILKSLHDSLSMYMQIYYQCYKLHLFQYTQLSNHLFTEYRTNYEENFNFIGIKKIEGVPKFFFFKGRQIKNFKFLYTYKKKFHIMVGSPWP